MHKSLIFNYFSKFKIAFFNIQQPTFTKNKPNSMTLLLGLFFVYYTEGGVKLNYELSTFSIIPYYARSLLLL